MIRAEGCFILTKEQKRSNFLQGKKFLLAVLTLSLLVNLFLVYENNRERQARQGSESEVCAYMDTAQEIFHSRQQEFEKVAQILEKKQDCKEFEISSKGIRSNFLQEKDSVSLQGELISFTKSEISVLENFFRGHDEERLNMWKINGSYGQIIFTLYTKGDYRIQLEVPPKSGGFAIYKVLQLRELNNGWGLVAMGKTPQQPEEGQSIWEKTDGKYRLKQLP